MPLNLARRVGPTLFSWLEGAIVLSPDVLCAPLNSEAMSFSVADSGIVVDALPYVGEDAEGSVLWWPGMPNSFPASLLSNRLCSSIAGVACVSDRVLYTAFSSSRLMSRDRFRANGL